MNDPTLLWAPQAWLDGWQQSVLLRIRDGRWSEITPNTPAPAGAAILQGPVLPGLVNAHSHAFQRAFAGLAEFRVTGREDFWTWRDRMYRVASRIDPPMQRVVARQLYGELLLGGYTHVCEFHYLHHRGDGRRYDDPLAMARALAEAAGDVGIGLTLIPVIYERAGFERSNLEPGQRPFAMSAAEAWTAAQAINKWNLPLVSAGVGAHSLRAAFAESIRELLRLSDRSKLPIHIHVAEQTGEVEACQKSTGLRPIEWLGAENFLDDRWHLVHATHTTPAELDLVEKARAGIVLCPNTEANLGDGVCDLSGILNRGIRCSIGSDSQITRSWPEELRMMEYAQRLAHRRRCLAADAASGNPSTGESLFVTTMIGGASAAGIDFHLRVGNRADLIVIDQHEPSLLGVPQGRLIDAMIFSSPATIFRDVLVAGQWRVRDHRLTATPIDEEFSEMMKQLWTGENY